MVSYLSMVSKLDKNRENQNQIQNKNKNKNKIGNRNNSNNNAGYDSYNDNNINNTNNKKVVSSTNSKSLKSYSYSDLVCSICQSNQIITDAESGELICSNCGQVISNKVEQEGPEWRNFDASSYSSSSQSNNSRVGMSTSLARHDMGLSTIIGRTDRDASGQKIDAAMRSTMDRLRT